KIEVLNVGRFQIFPDQASTTARHVDWLYFYLTGWTAIFSLLVFVPLIWFAVKYRRGAKVDRSRPASSSWRLEIAWTLIPTFIAMTMFAWGAMVYFEIERPPGDALLVDVVAKQWMWKLQH